MADHRVLALLGRGLIPSDTPILRADDLGALRGDGVFETVHVRDQRGWLLDAHLARMARSAERLQLALPATARLTELAETALGAWPARLEGSLRLVCTRGPEPGGGATTFAMITEVAPSVLRARREGLAVLTATIGLAAGQRSQAPWLLGGAKTLSYAMNMASQRWAAGLGADDVLWISSDGYALEAPTSSLVWLDGDTLCTVPASQTGILPSTTTEYLLAHAEALGWRTEERMIAPAALRHSGGAWLASSVRGIAPIRTLDTAALPWAPEHSTRILDLLGFAGGPPPAGPPTADRRPG